MKRAGPAQSSVHAETVTVKEAAQLLGVSEVTMRRWDSSGRFKAARHPINGYRLYRLRDLVRLKRVIDGQDPKRR